MNRYVDTIECRSHNESIDTSAPDERTKPTDWRDTIDLGHIENNEMRTKILTLLTKHEDMWTTGRLGEITATEHRITLETGTKPTRSMLYRQASRPGDTDESGGENTKNG